MRAECGTSERMTSSDGPSGAVPWGYMTGAYAGHGRTAQNSIFIAAGSAGPTAPGPPRGSAGPPRIRAPKGPAVRFCRRIRRAEGSALGVLLRAASEVERHARLVSDDPGVMAG